LTSTVVSDSFPMNIWNDGRQARVHLPDRPGWN
jgi:hypothetical protein